MSKDLEIQQTLKEVAVELLNSPDHEPYFVTYATQFLTALEKTKLDADNPEKNTPLLLGAFFQVFWEELPDEPEIRKLTFFRVCSVAEMFCEYFDTPARDENVTPEQFALVKSLFSD